MKLVAAVVLALFVTGHAYAQVSPGCSEVPGGGMQCYLQHTYYDGVLLNLLTVATLPACTAALKGVMRAVSDATAPAYNATLTGGGAVTVPVLCNGTAWVAH